MAAYDDPNSEPMTLSAMFRCSRACSGQFDRLLWTGGHAKTAGAAGIYIRCVRNLHAMDPQLKLTQYSELAVVLVLDPCHCEHVLWAYPHTIGLALTAIEVNDGLDDACRLFALGNAGTHEFLSNFYGTGSHA